MITTHQEDYLRAIYHLREENEQIEGIRHRESRKENVQEIKSNDIASYLSISRPSVSRMILSLSEKSLVRSARYGRVSLTKKGEDIARVITAKHRIIELFLKDTLKISSGKIHDMAHRLEHAFDDEAIHKLRNFLGNPKKDPHGRYIPR